VKNAGFKAIKFQCMRPRAADDAAASAQVKAATGPEFRVMPDRTAHLSGSLWDYPTGLAAAKALQDAGVYWLEEPFSRDDFESPARLAREVDILITGGEGYNGLALYRECLTHDTYDILQPDCRTAGAILTLCKVAAMAEAWHKPVCPHGNHSLALAGRLQASAGFGSDVPGDCGASSAFRAGRSGRTRIEGAELEGDVRVSRRGDRDSASTGIGS